MIIALSAVGYAYAHWYDMVTIEGEVYTGTLEIVITDKLQEIWVWVDGDHWVPQSQLPAEKQVMGCVDAWVGDLVVVDCEYAPDKTGPMYKGVKFTLTNAYPETAFKTYAHIHNVGSIPAHWVSCEAKLYVWDPDPDGDPQTDDAAWVEAAAADFAGLGIEVWAEAYGYYPDGSYAKIPVSYDPSTGMITVDPEYQFHPCEGIDVTIWYYFTNILPECAKFRGELVFNFNQWNWASVPAQPPVIT